MKIQKPEQEFLDYLFNKKSYKDFPSIIGNIATHWKAVGDCILNGKERNLEDYLKNKIIPPHIKKWEMNPNWTKYELKKPPTQIDYPDEEVLTLDIEVAVTMGHYPTMCVALGKNAWYVWLSPVLFGGSNNHLIPLGDRKKKNLVVIGHNIVGYDRAKIKEEYQLESNGIYYLDTMSLHVAVAGLTSKQRPLYMKNKKELEEGIDPSMSELWFNYGSMNNLKEVVNHHLGIKMDKTIRDIFVHGTLQEIKNKIQELIDYNVLDVLYTYKLARELWFKFKQKAPHPVTRAAVLLLSKTYLPTTREKWFNYIRDCESLYSRRTKDLERSLREIVEEEIKKWEKDEEYWVDDPWLSQLNWDKPSKRARTLKNKPEWYRQLWDSKRKDIKITVKTRITPILLRVKWSGVPLYFQKDLKWGILVKSSDNKPEIPTPPNYLDNNLELISGDSKGKSENIFYRIPHPDGDANVGNPLANNYIKEMETGILSSENELAKEALKIAVEISYWVSTKKRIMDQFLVNPKGDKVENGEWYGETIENPDGVIIPSLSPIGTVSRRASENTWLTASNPKKTKIGSEIKTTIVAPEGFKIVGADVSSQEAWIACSLGDSYAQHLFIGVIGDMCREDIEKGWEEGTRMGKIGKTKFSQQVLAGDKKTGTDIHSVAAKILGIDRDGAKVVNYCVPLEAKALTPEGWKSHEEINKGDLVMGYNKETKKQEWTLVKEKVYFDEVPTYRMENKQGKFNHVSTENHRWIGDKRKTKNKKRYYEDCIFTTEEIISENRILISAESNLEKKLPLSKEEVELIAWLGTDGTLKTRGNYIVARIFQSKKVNPSYVKEIEEIITKLNLGVSRKERGDGVIIWCIQTGDGKLREILNKAELNPNIPNYEKLVLKLDTESIKTFLEVCYKAEGSMDGKNLRIAQNEGSMLEAIQLAGQLSGYTTIRRHKEVTSSGKNHYDVTISPKLKISGQRLIKTYEGKQKVWCVVTESGTWVMRQGDCITITGNSRYYGAGLRSTAAYLKQYNKLLASSEAYNLSKRLFTETKGEKRWDKMAGCKLWQGGSESDMFNALEYIASQGEPRTPVLGAAMSEALLPKNDLKNMFQTSRINWTVQSSGVDFLHLLIVGIEFLFRRYKIKGRLMLTIHDEIRYIVKEEQVEKAAWIMNIVHSWVVGLFAYRLKLKEIPETMRYFESIDVDHTLRKEVDLDCVTPSKREPEPKGRAILPEEIM